MEIYGTATLNDGGEYLMCGEHVYHRNTAMFSLDGPIVNITPEEFLHRSIEHGVRDITGHGDLDEEECIWVVINNKTKVLLHGVDHVRDWLKHQLH